MKFNAQHKNLWWVAKSYNHLYLFVGCEQGRRARTGSLFKIILPTDPVFIFKLFNLHLTQKFQLPILISFFPFDGYSMNPKLKAVKKTAYEHNLIHLSLSFHCTTSFGFLLTISGFGTLTGEMKIKSPPLYTSQYVDYFVLSFLFVQILLFLCLYYALCEPWSKYKVKFCKIGIPYINLIILQQRKFDLELAVFRRNISYYIICGLTCKIFFSKNQRVWIKQLFHYRK